MKYDMKTRKLLNIFMAIAVLYAWGSMFLGLSQEALAARGLASLRYFTILSNLLEAFACVVWLINGNEKIKYIAAVSVSVTFIVVMVFLGPLFGYAAMFYGVSFWLHGVVPLCAIFEFLFCNRTKFSQKDSLLAALPMMIYGLFYVGNILINGVGEWPHSNDWYGFMSWGYPIGFAIYFFISLATWAFALFLKKANEAIIERI